IAERRRISSFVYRPEEHPQDPILIADRPWETETDDGIELDTQATLYDEEAGLFKMWYLPAPWPGGCQAVVLCGLTERLWLAETRPRPRGVPGLDPEQHREGSRYTTGSDLHECRQDAA